MRKGLTFQRFKVIMLYAVVCHASKPDNVVR
nr:MAG TPA_asm: hypothetical protein [Caudoviricetes sp.]